MKILITESQYTNAVKSIVNYIDGQVESYSLDGNPETIFFYINYKPGILSSATPDLLYLPDQELLIVYCKNDFFMELIQIFGDEIWKPSFEYWFKNMAKKYWRPYNNYLTKFGIEELPTPKRFDYYELGENNKN
jgi:hypothetical protein